MKRILIIGGSGGIGAALVREARGDVTTLSRRDDGLDISDPMSVERAVNRIDGPFDRIIVAVGVLGTPEKSLSAINAREMRDVFAVNTFGPALVLRHVPNLLAIDGRVAVLSARVGSIGDNKIGGWHSYRASKAALNQIVRGAAIELSRTHKQSVCVAIHPGTVATDFTAQYASRHKMKTADAAATQLWDVIEGLGVDQSGGFFDYAGNTVPW